MLLFSLFSCKSHTNLIQWHISNVQIYTIFSNIRCTRNFIILPVLYIYFVCIILVQNEYYWQLEKGPLRWKTKRTVLLKTAEKASILSSKLGTLYQIVNKQWCCFRVLFCHCASTNHFCVCFKCSFTLRVGYRILKWYYDLREERKERINIKMMIQIRIFMCPVCL